jgi:hypothetical protein
MLVAPPSSSLPETTEIFAPSARRSKLLLTMVAFASIPSSAERCWSLAMIVTFYSLIVASACVT